MEKDRDKIIAALFDIAAERMREAGFFDNLVEARLAFQKTNMRDILAGILNENVMPLLQAIIEVNKLDT